MKKILILLVTITIGQFMHAQSVGIGTTMPNASALLDISSTTKGMLMPRMTTSQRNAIVTPAAGLQILNLDDYCLDIYDGTGWIKNCGFKVIGTDTAQSDRSIANFGGVARDGAVAFSIGTKGYVGTGHDGTNRRKDFWEYDPSTNVWTQKADFGGTARSAAVAFVVYDKGYVGTGLDGNFKKDLWQYDPVTNAWVQKADMPGGFGREHAIAFSIGSYGYVGLGYNTAIDAYYDDMYEYYPPANAWMTKTNYPVRAHSMIAFTIGDYGYVGIGKIRSTLWGDYLDNLFYTFNSAGSGTWTVLADFPGTPRKEAVGFCIGSKGYVGTGKTESATFFNDMYEFNDATNSWTQMANVGPTGRTRAVSFVVNGEAFIGTGTDGSYKSDFFGYVPNRVGPVYQSTPDISLSGGVSDGIWIKDANKIKTDNMGVSNLMITSAGNVGIGTDISHAPLQFSNSLKNRKIVLYESTNNDHQFSGFGINSGLMRYQVAATTNDHVFYAATSSITSKELFRITGFGQVSMGTNSPDPSALFHMNNTDKGILIPRMTSAQRNAIATPAHGLLVFDTSTNSFWFKGTSAWQELIDNLDTEVYRNGADKIYMGMTDSVGIGTNNPAYKLQVKTSFNDYGVSHTDGSVGIATWVGDGGEIGTVSNHSFSLYANNGIHQFQLMPNGNIGMGVYNPGNKLDILSGAARTGTHATGSPLYITGSLSDASNGVEIRHADGTQGIGFGKNTMYAAGSSTNQNLGLWAKGSTGNLLFSTNSLERMRINGTGNVGIGVSTPVNKIDINNGAVRTGTHASGIALYATGTFLPAGSGVEFRHDNGTQGIGFGSTTMYAAGSNASQDLGMSAKGASGNLIFSTNGAERMRIAGAGNMGIATPAPDQPLSVANKFGVDANGAIHIKNTPRAMYFMEDGAANRMLLSHSPAFPKWGLQYLGTSNEFRFLGDSIMVMSVNLGANSVEMNKLGIGTPTPHALIHLVNGAANRKIILNELADNNNQYDGFGINADNSLRYQTQSTSNDHIFYAGATSSTSNELARIKGNGNVAISGVIEVEAFSAPTLLNSFTNYGAAFATAGYYKDKMGIVHLRGLVTHVGEPDGLTIFTLPVGYRPATSGQLLFSALNNDTLGRVDVMSNGNVVVAFGISGWVNLNGISFRAD